MKKSALLLLICLILFSCSTTNNQPVSLTPLKNTFIEKDLGKELVTPIRDKNIMVSIMGFWNNESFDLSKMTTINYSSVLNKVIFHKYLSEKLSTENIALIDETYLQLSQNKDFTQENLKTVVNSVKDVTNILHLYLTSSDFDIKDFNISFPNIFSFKEPYSSNIDSFYVIIGLEQLTKLPNGLTSGVAVIKLNNNGEVLSFMISQYDFTKINPEIFSNIIYEAISLSNF